MKDHTAPYLFHTKSHRPLFVASVVHSRSWSVFSACPSLIDLSTRRRGTMWRRAGSRNLRSRLKCKMRS